MHPIGTISIDDAANPNLLVADSGVDCRILAVITNLLNLILYN